MKTWYSIAIFCPMCLEMRVTGRNNLLVWCLLSTTFWRRHPGWCFHSPKDPVKINAQGRSIINSKSVAIWNAFVKKLSLPVRVHEKVSPKQMETVYCAIFLFIIWKFQCSLWLLRAKCRFHCSVCWVFLFCFVFCLFFFSHWLESWNKGTGMRHTNRKNSTFAPCTNSTFAPCTMNNWNLQLWSHNFCCQRLNSEAQRTNMSNLYFFPQATKLQLTWRLPFGQYSCKSMIFGGSMTAPMNLTRLSWIRVLLWGKKNEGIFRTAGDNKFRLYVSFCESGLPWFTACCRLLTSPKALTWYVRARAGRESLKN